LYEVPGCVQRLPKRCLYFGFENRHHRFEIGSSPLLLTWPEEIIGAVVFLGSFLAVWDALPAGSHVNGARLRLRSQHFSPETFAAIGQKSFRFTGSN